MTIPQSSIVTQRLSLALAKGQRSGGTRKHVFKISRPTGATAAVCMRACACAKGYIAAGQVYARGLQKSRSNYGDRGGTARRMESKSRGYCAVLLPLLLLLLHNSTSEFRDNAKVENTSRHDCGDFRMWKFNSERREQSAV
ncbi:hypothetical protein TSAR_003119 [Trichomalopsis sarcophagae]|uniref:Uncharacterized protein n=1 Tax=Trichomalopsis sarcophagae TaxID=543379 RepID=A0A232EYY2_9HYME|nr:hypothetical protein TSAR_003119 [Trichomalopsis sarcophagae]